MFFINVIVCRFAGFFLHLLDEGGKIVRAAGNGVDVETKQRQFVGDTLEVAVLRLVVGLCKTFGFLAAGAQYADGAVVTQERECILCLVKNGIQRRQAVAHFRVAEEGVERLFDLAEIALDFARDLGDQQAFLRLARHFVKQRDFCVRFRRRAGKATVNARNGDVDLVGEVVAQVCEIFLRILRQQQAGGDFHGQRVGMTRSVFA